VNVDDSIDVFMTLCCLGLIPLSKCAQNTKYKVLNASVEQNNCSQVISVCMQSVLIDHERCSAAYACAFCNKVARHIR
jgi:hypothetical protein